MSDNGHSIESGLITEVGAVAGAVVATQVAPPVTALSPGAAGVDGDSQPTDVSRKVAPSIAGISALKGLILYGATLTFTGLYAYFIVEIFGAAPGTQPKFDAAMVSAAAALAGVLGSAFALEVGTPQEESKTNRDLAEALRVATKSTERAKARIRQIFSLEGGSTTNASWPKTFGIWVYAIVATAVALTYVLNQTETPSTIKALAVAFGGYVVALINNAYHA